MGVPIIFPRNPEKQNDDNKNKKKNHGSFTNDSMIHPGLTTSFLTFALWTLWWIWKVLIVNQRTCDLASICAAGSPTLEVPYSSPFGAHFGHGTWM